MKEDDFDVFELNQKSDLMAVQCQCPQCGEKYIHGVPYANVSCGKCGITYKTDFKQDIYTKKARQLLAKLAYSNGLKLRIHEEYDLSAYGIRQHFVEMHCWDVSEIKRTNEDSRMCQKCGICLNCFTCEECSGKFQRNMNRRKQACPKCKSDKLKRTHFNEIVTNEKKEKICPHCKSDKIKMTRTHNKTMCHICNSTSLTEPRKDVVFEFTIERKKAYRRENV